VGEGNGGEGRGEEGEGKGKVVPPMLETRWRHWSQSFWQWCKRDQILQTKTKITRPRPKTTGSKQKHLADLTFRYVNWTPPLISTVVMFLRPTISDHITGFWVQAWVPKNIQTLPYNFKYSIWPLTSAKKMQLQHYITISYAFLCSFFSLCLPLNIWWIKIVRPITKADKKQKLCGETSTVMSRIF